MARDGFSMKVLHLNTHASGGSYEYAALLSTALADEGIESRVLCKDSQPLKAGRNLADRVIRKGYVSFSTKAWHGTRRLLAPPRPDELQDFDLVHLHTVADWFNVPRWLEMLPSDLGVIVTLHDLWHITGGCFLFDNCDRFIETCAPCPILKTPLNRILAKDEQHRKLQAYRARRVQFVSNSQWLADLSNRSPIVRACGRAQVIPPGIDTDVFRPQDKSGCRAELGIPGDAFVLAAGAASLTDSNKNIAWLLQQLAGLPDLEDVMVVLAGEGNVEIPNKLNVRLMGGISDRSKRAAFFCAADVFVSASLMETYGLTLIEAMSCGVPAVAFRTGGVPEAVPEQGGILCDLHDATGFKAAIQKLRNNEAFRDELGDAASKLVAARNAKSRFATEYARLYETYWNNSRTRHGDEGSLSSPLHLHRETPFKAELCKASDQL
jgi:glycosyltransferase involved in cell wall biosynthesis